MIGARAFSRARDNRQAMTFGFEFSGVDIDSCAMVSKQSALPNCNSLPWGAPNVPGTPPSSYYERHSMAVVARQSGNEKIARLADI
jgi:hypothetical protein